MFGRHHPNQFSIIVHLDRKTNEDIEHIRKLLPASPYRDDEPHVTILHDIRAPGRMTNHELLDSIEPSLNRILKLRSHAKVHGITNMAGGHYKTASAIVLTSSPELQSEHSKLATNLLAMGFKLGKEAEFYKPHVTIRLGVPLTDMAQTETQRLFPKGRDIRLAGWAVLRLKSQRLVRPMYELDP